MVEPQRKQAAIAPLTASALCWRWIGACAVAELIGMSAAASAAAGSVYLGIDDSSSAAPLNALAYLLFVLAGAIEGAALGYFQGRVLHQVISNFNRTHWLGACTAIAVLGWGLGMIAPIFGSDANPSIDEPSPTMALLFMVIIGIGAGLLIGAVQAVLLARCVSESWRWIPANMLGWGLAFLAIQIGASLPSEDWAIPFYVLDGLLTGAIAGALLGLATAPVLLRFRRAQHNT